MCRSHSYVSEYPTAFKCSTIHGISQGEKYVDDIRPTCESKVQVWQPSFLVPWHYVDTVGKNKKAISDRGIYPQSAYGR